MRCLNTLLVATRAMRLVLLPLRCMSCAQILAREEPYHLCAQCREEVVYNARKPCPACSLALARNTCLCCPAGPQSFDSAHATLAYNNFLTRLFVRGRRRGQTDVWRQLSAYVADDARAHALAQTGMCLIPLPSDPERIAQRGFDPSAQIAQHLARAWHMPLATPLVRIRKTQEQSAMNRLARRRNMTAAFMARHTLDGTVALVDDCMVTGASARAAARALRQAGAKRIVVLVVARALG